MALIVIFLSSRLFVHQLDAIGPWPQFSMALSTVNRPGAFSNWARRSSGRAIFQNVTKT